MVWNHKLGEGGRPFWDLTLEFQDPFNFWFLHLTPKKEVWMYTALFPTYTANPAVAVATICASCSVWKCCKPNNTMPMHHEKNMATLLADLLWDSS
jgi:hypothetical protein